MHRLCASLAILTLFSIAAHATSPRTPLIRTRVLEKEKALSATLPSPTQYFPQSPGGQAQWSNYLLNIAEYQKSYPGLFMPLDLVRWDKLPEDWLKTQIRKHGLAWQRLKDKTLEFKERRTQRLVLSRRANQELFDAEKKLEAQQQLWIGSTRALLDSLKPEERSALTPLDSAFQTSELGKEIFKRLSEKSSSMITGFLIDPKLKKIVLETGSSDYFKVEFLDDGSPEFRVRTFWGYDERLGTDLKQRKENFRGYLLNGSNERLPLGNYPAVGGVFLDERGTAHFAGDGHNHEASATTGTITVPSGWKAKELIIEKQR